MCSKIKNRNKLLYIIIAWNNYAKVIPLILSQPKPLIFLLCECSVCNI